MQPRICESNEQTAKYGLPNRKTMAEQNIFANRININTFAKRTIGQKEFEDNEIANR